MMETIVVEECHDQIYVSKKKSLVEVSKMITKMRHWRERTDWRPLPLNSWQWKLNIQKIFNRISRTYYSVRYDRFSKKNGKQGYNVSINSRFWGRR